MNIFKIFDFSKDILPKDKMNNIEINIFKKIFAYLNPLIGIKIIYWKQMNIRVNKIKYKYKGKLFNFFSKLNELKEHPIVANGIISIKLPKFEPIFKL